MSKVALSQVNIIAVGVENYRYMRPLRGPRRDIERFLDLLIDSSPIGLYKQSQVKNLIDPDSTTLRENINDLVINRSAQGDVLIFYFSGHGVPIGHSDFGFCTIDTRFQDVAGSVLPLTVLRFRDLMDSLYIMNIIPVIIIDACYSGMVGNAISLPASDAIMSMQRDLTRPNATNYALLCSCSDRQVSIGDNNGGIFSQTIFNVFEEGFDTHDTSKSKIYFQDVFHQITLRTCSIFADSTPQLYLGETLPWIPIVKNSGYTPRREHFFPYMREIILTMWNSGEERELSRSEILETIGRGAYGNHRKLSCVGWGLIEDNPINHKRRLTDRGRQFARGEISIPDEVVFDSGANEYIASPDASLLSIEYVSKHK